MGRGEGGEGSWVRERRRGPLVHEPVALKACLCLASLLEAHLLIPTKEKNDVGNMWMSSPPCWGSPGRRARCSAWGRKQGERVLKVLGEAGGKSQVFSVLSKGTEREVGKTPPAMLSIIICAPFKPSKRCHKPELQWQGGKHSGTFMPHLVALTPAPGTGQDVF